jgi:hypothetical protein
MIQLLGMLFRSVMSQLPKAIRHRSRKLFLIHEENTPMMNKNPNKKFPITLFQNSITFDCLYGG